MSTETARAIAEAGGTVASCPVDKRACLAELCEPEFGIPCMKIRAEITRRNHEVVRRQYLSLRTETWT